MILPIGKDGFSFRRMPWATISIILLCSIIFAFTDHHNSPIREKLGVVGDEYIELWVKNPYLPFPKILFDHKKYKDIEDKIDMYFDLCKSETFVYPEDEAFKNVWSQGRTILNRLSYLRSTLAVFKWGYNNTNRSIFTFFTSNFVHSDWDHLFWNMLFLFFAGAFLEELWGKPFFLLFYFFAGAFSTLGADLIHPDVNITSIGASGAVSGVIGAFLLRFWNEKVRFIWWGFYTFPFKAPGWIMAIFEIGRQLYFGLLQDSMENVHHGIGYWAHFSGLIFGVIVIIIIKWWKIEEKLLKPKLDAEFSYIDKGHKRYVEIHEMITKG